MPGVTLPPRYQVTEVRHVQGLFKANSIVWLRIPGCEQPHPGMWIPHPDLNIRTPGCEPPHPGMWIPHPDLNIRTPGCKPRHPGMWIPHPDLNIPTPGCEPPHPGMWIPHPDLNIRTPGCEPPHPGMWIPHPDLNKVGRVAKVGWLTKERKKKKSKISKKRLSQVVFFLEVLKVFWCWFDSGDVDGPLRIVRRRLVQQSTWMKGNFPFIGLKAV